MVLKASAPGNDRAKTEKWRCGGREVEIDRALNKATVNMLLLANDPSN